MTYVIGDVHGEFDDLRELLNKIPSNSDIYFVGDLVDRGRKSKEVIEYIRKMNYQTVLGNHEKMMIEFSDYFLKEYPNIPFIGFIDTWIKNGGKQTLQSYGLIEQSSLDGKITCKVNEKAFCKFRDDIYWLKKLPLYIELDKKIDKKNVVISHASIADIWYLIEDGLKKDRVEEYALWNRKPPKKDCKIYNIFGHTPINKVDTTKHYINVDTGCCYKNDGLGKLSAFCIETKDVLTT